MKWIFLTLLFANIAYLASQLLIPASPEPVVPGSTHGGQSILLLSERTGESDRIAEIEAVLDDPVSPEPINDTGRCLGFGAFENVIAAQNVAERLTAVGYSVELSAVDRLTGEFDYRVVMPPFNSLQEAFRRLRELKSQDIDSYVISQGKDAQGISLGLFSTQEAAVAHRASLEAMGYTIRINEIPRVVRGYWVVGPEVSYSPSLIQEFEAAHPDISMNETACTD